GAGAPPPRLPPFDWAPPDPPIGAGRGVAADGAVHLPDAAPRHVGEFPPRHGRGPAGDLQDVAGPGANPCEIRRRQPGNAMRDVFDARFGHAQQDRLSARRGRLVHDAAPKWRWRWLGERPNIAPSGARAVSLPPASASPPPAGA